MKRTILVSAMCLLMMLSAYKTTAQVVASGTTGDCTWELTGIAPNLTLTISGSGAIRDYAEYCDDAPWYSYQSNIKTVDIQQGVTAIGKRAFIDCSGITSVSIGNSVTSIGERAFVRCGGLTSVNIGNSVTTIGNYAFSSCSSLTSITIPNSVTAIEDYAFYRCSGLTSVTVGNSVTSIGDYAFAYCSGLTLITIPNSVITVGDAPFAFCSNLINIYVDANNPDYSSIDGVLFNKLQDLLIQCPAGKSGNYTIPNSVTVIGNYAFSDCIGLTSITIPNSVTTIGSYAFAECIGLTSITIPNSVTTIGDYAFYLCTDLTSVTIPNSATTIRETAFVGCTGLITIAVDAGNPNYCSINGVLFSKLQDTLWQCPAGRTGSYTIPNSVTAIGDYAFYGCSGLTSVTIPNSVTAIGKWAFFVCLGFTSITIPNSVTIIGDYAFCYCSSLNRIYVKATTPPDLGNDVFAVVSPMIPVYVCGSVEDYRHSKWGNFMNILQDNSCASGIEAISLEDICLHPNPATESVTVLLPENTNRALFVLYDMQGKALLRQEVSSGDAVEVRHLAAGIYLYQVAAGTQRYQGKVIKQ